MDKGIAIIFETIIAGIVILAAFRFFIPRGETRSRWDNAMLLTMVRDTLVTLDRIDTIEKLVKNSTLLNERLNQIFPYPHVWYLTVEFSNGTKEEVTKFRPMVSSQVVSYLDVYKENFVYNPSFEVGSSEDAYNWTEGVNHSRTDSLYHSGRYSIKSNFTGSFTFTISDSINLKPNTMYVLRGWIYNSLTRGRAYLDLNDIFEECEANSTNGLNQWEYVSCVFTTGPATTEVRVRLVTENTDGEVWFDDIGIDKLMIANVKLFVGYPF